MKVKVTEEGVVIPKQLLEGVEEVEIQKEENLIVVIPATKKDPIFDLGENPVKCGVINGSEHHDMYIYNSNS